ncbi:MAG: hypothetical protein HYV46_20800 [candidate division NC10 bacterium]|nr:hypothetical protein [candidate division NC10 bacterium]
MPFEARDVGSDRQALEELLKFGFKATPVTVIDGEIVVGFDRGKLQRLLGIS